MELEQVDENKLNNEEGEYDGGVAVVMDLTGEGRGEENMPLLETDIDKTDYSEGAPICQQVDETDETEAGTWSSQADDDEHDQVATEISFPQNGKDIHPVTCTQPFASSREGWDIVEDSTSEESESEDMQRPKFSKFGHSGSELILARKAKFDAQKENRKDGDGRQRAISTGEESHKHNEEKLRRRAYTSEKCISGSKKKERKRNARESKKDRRKVASQDLASQDFGSPELQRPKFCSFGHSNVEMVLSKRAKFLAGKEGNKKLNGNNSEQTSHKIEESAPTNDGKKTKEKSKKSKKSKKLTKESSGMSSTSALALSLADFALAASCKATLELGDEDGGSDEGGVDEDDDESYTIYDNSGHIVAVEDQDGNLDDKSNENDSDKPSSPRRKVMFGGGNDKEEDEGDDSKVKDQKDNEIKLNGTSKGRRRRITFDEGVDHSKMGDMLGEMGHYGEEENTQTAQRDSNLEPKPLFVQLNEHEICALSELPRWKPRARWIKFEETWEEGANKWGKPHVASLTFNSLPQLRRGLENGLMLLDVMETSLPNIFNRLVDGLVNMDLIDPEHEEALLRMLNLYGTGNKTHQPKVSAVRRMSLFPGNMTGFNGGMDNNFSNNATHVPDNMTLFNVGSDNNYSNNATHSSDEVHVSMPANTYGNINKNSNNSQHHIGGGAHREGILRKLPEDAEGAMVMVAMEDSLTGPVAALIRLEDPPVFDHFLEAPIPLRFIFLLVGPEYSNVNYREVGRAMSTLFSDDVFRELAYKAVDRQDLLNGINEFLNDTMVLPPGDWDRDLLLPITRQVKREQEKVMQRRKTISHFQMQQDAEAILKMQQAFEHEALKNADPLERTGLLFGGLINDVKRRFPHYKSDITDAFNFQSIAAFVFVYFACLSPAITFGGLLAKKTDNWMGVSEMIVSTSLCGMLFALLSGQPLVILGGTGPVLIFEEYLYKSCKQADMDFLAFRTWIGFWILILAIIVVAFEGSILVRYFTRFTEEVFSTLISVIFVYEVYKGLQYIICANPVLPNYSAYEPILNVTEPTLESTYYPNFDYAVTTESYMYETPHTGDGYDSKYEKYNCNATEDKYAHKKDYGCSPSNDPQPNTALFAIILTCATFFISYFLKVFRSSQFLGRTARRALANFGIAIAIFTVVTIAYSVSDILYTDKIKITDGFHPTDPCKRGWLINPMGHKKPIPILAVFIAIVPAFLVFILLYMETLLIGMVVNKESNKLHKGTGYHLDLFLIGILSALAGVMGLPWMCAAPIRTVSHIGSLSVLTRTHAPGVKPKLDHIKDQRVTNFAVSFLIGLSTLLAPVLRQVPIAALLGVFLYLGITSLSGLQFIERLKILFMPQKHHPDVRYIRMVKMWKMHMFTVIQVVCVIALYLIKNSIIAMAFPFCLILLVLLRRLLKYLFTESELEALDCEEEDEDEEHQVFDFDLG